VTMTIGAAPSRRLRWRSEGTVTGAAPVGAGAAVGAVIREAAAGSVYSWVTVRRAFQPAFEADVPYTIVTVDLDGGGRMVGRLEPREAVSAGLRVGPHFVPHQGWTEVRFHPE